MTFFELMLLTVADHRSGFGTMGAVMLLLGSAMYGVGRGDGLPLVKNVGRGLVLLGLTHCALATWVPEERRLRCVMHMVCK